ncbi:MAG: pyrimidine-nucleoside phosphorylase [Erysipelotrichaceae bacterium]|jgi:pyrimidine-nucleoside phosphorylase|nr:pyrimidine-nucleoside phosphorylase [Erysipelotrichaceae bacterium]
MRMVDLIIKKREGLALSKEEIAFWISGYVKNEIPDYQTSAMLMAIIFQGMTEEEVINLTSLMEHSGQTLDLSVLKGVKVDKHSTGGVGDKTSLVLGPMVAACGATVAKLSGRGLGHTGGTLDKLESIPGFNVQINGERFVKQVNDIGIILAGQTASLVPADKKMYALRDVTGTVESIPLIAASIMSKKLAAGTDTILLDVTVGNGAFMKDIIQAETLAKLMVKIGKGLNRDTRAVLSNMDEPLGLAVGNALEVKEAISALKGNGPEDLMELCYTCGSIMLMQAKLANSFEEAKMKLERVIKDGSAFNLFVKMVEAQSGDISYILNPDKFIVADKIIPVLAKTSGYIKTIEALDIGVSSMRLGGGRATIEDVIDMSAGIVLNKKVGDKVEKNDVLCYLHTNKDDKEIASIIGDVEKAFVIVPEFVAKHKVILEIIE